MNTVTMDLINRAAMILACEGTTEVKVASILMESGVSAENAFLAVKAAKILVKGTSK